MTIFHRLASVIRWVFRRNKAEQELDREMESFVELSAAEKVRDGLTPDGARRRAILELGGVEQAKEKVRTYRHGALLDELSQDFRYAFRMFRKNPTFTLVVVVTLALGIGANTAIFSLTDAILLKSLPVHDPARLVQIRRGTSAAADLFTNPIWEQVRDDQQLFDGVLAYTTMNLNTASSGEAHPVKAILSSGNYLDVLGVKMAIGRSFTREDDHRGCGGNGPLAVLSHDFWLTQYEGSPAVLGTTIALEGHNFTIIGVTPPRFTGVDVGQSFDVISPLCSIAILRGNDSALDSRDMLWLNLIARLKAGMLIEQAESGLRSLQPGIREATLSPRTDYLKDPFILTQASAGLSTSCTDCLRFRATYTQPLFVLMAVVGLVLLIACGNIASLMLARAAARSKEIAVRTSIGASRWRLIRQLLVESSLLGLMGAALGTVLAQWASRLLVLELSTNHQKVFLDLGIDWRVLMFTIGAGIGTGILFGIVPALRTTYQAPGEIFQRMTRGASPSDARVGMGRWLVAFQVGLSLVLVFGATLFLRSYWKLAQVPSGFEAPGVLLASLDVSRVPAATDEGRILLYDRVLEAVRSIPRVRSSAYSLFNPIVGGGWRSGIQVDGYKPASKDDVTFFNSISPAYFETFGTTLIAGRDFDSHDSRNATRVAVVNETFARKFFAGRNPLGATFRMPGSITTPPNSPLLLTQVVGLVQDTKYSNLRAPDPPMAYVPWSQSNPVLRHTLSVKTSNDAASLAPEVIKAIAGVDKNIVLTISTFQSQVDDSLVTEHLMALMSGFFGFLALTVAAVGLAGLVSYSVTRRRAEIGIRAALGATPGSLVRLVMRDLILLIGSGLAFGTLLSLAGARFVASMLYQVTANDPMTLLIAGTTLVIVAAVAGYIPARRAAEIDPMECLKTE